VALAGPLSTRCRVTRVLRSREIFKHAAGLVRSSGGVCSTPKTRTARLSTTLSVPKLSLEASTFPVGVDHAQEQERDTFL
jgi:hypothetical protein